MCVLVILTFSTSCPVSLQTEDEMCDRFRIHKLGPYLLLTWLSEGLQLNNFFLQKSACTVKRQVGQQRVHVHTVAFKVRMRRMRTVMTSESIGTVRRRQVDWPIHGRLDGWTAFLIDSNKSIRKNSKKCGGVMSKSSKLIRKLVRRPFSD